MKIRSLTYVNLSELVTALGLDTDQVLNSIDTWSFGDTLFTLVGNSEFLHHLLDNFVEQDESERKAFTERFWNVLGGDENAYVNLEG